MVIRLVNKTSRRRTCDLWLLWTRSFQKWPNMTGFRPGIEAKGVKGAKPWAVFRWSLQWGDSWARAHGSAVPWYCWDMKQKVMEMWIHCKWLGGYNFHHFSVGCVYGMVWPVVAAGILKPLKDPRWKNFHRKFKGNQVIGGKIQPTYDINDSIFSMYNYIHRYIIYIFYLLSYIHIIFSRAPSSSCPTWGPRPMRNVKTWSSNWRKLATFVKVEQNPAQNCRGFLTTAGADFRNSTRVTVWWMIV